MLRRSKYGNKKVTAFGMKFDSILERDRFFYLKAAQDQGRISDLRCQVEFPIEVNGDPICCYIADFVYFRKGHRGEASPQVVEDAKGMKTSVYALKEKLMLAVHGVKIRIVKKPTEEI